MQGAACLKRMALVTAGAASLAACATVQPTSPGIASAGPHGSSGAAGSRGGLHVGPPYQVNGIWYVPREQPDYDQVGTASWYGDAFDGRPTADGELFDMNAASAAHTTLPLPSIVEVTNLDNGRKLKVRVNDRGPFVGDRIIDLSHEAARQLGYDRQGLARVRVRYVGPAPLLGPEAGVRIARARPPAVAEGATRYASATAGGPRPYASVWKAAPATPPASPMASAAPPAPVARHDEQNDEVAFVSAPVSTPRQLQIVTAMPTQPAPAAAERRYRVQAAAFSDPARAQRVAAQLDAYGAAVVEPLQRNGLTLYRVIVTGPADALGADNLRARVAQAGFTDARVIGPS